MLSARRGSDSAAICPECTLLVRPVFSESGSGDNRLPGANPDELAAAILESVEAGARVINLSLALVQPSMKSERFLQAALDYATLHGVIVVAAAGNQNAMGSTVITRHPWVIPAVACDRQGKPATYSNFGRSIGSRGLSAPGEGATGSDSNDGATRLFGTSIAAPYITGAIALLWSMYPAASAHQVRLAVTQARTRRAGVVPPLLDAWMAYQTLAGKGTRRSRS